MPIKKTRSRRLQEQAQLVLQAKSCRSGTIALKLYAHAVDFETPRGIRMNFKTKMLACGAAALVFSGSVAKAMYLEKLDENGKPIPYTYTETPQEAAEEAGRAEGFKLSLKVEKKEYVLGEPVHLKVMFKNLDRDLHRKGLTIPVRSGFTFRLEILRPDGTLAPLTAEGEKRKKREHLP